MIITICSQFDISFVLKTFRPYDNRWSKTMIGYGPESSHFVIELTYNYGVKTYEYGNDFDGITIKSKEVLERARKNNYPITVETNKSVLRAPDGYTFYIVDEPQPKNGDPVTRVGIRSSDLDRSLNYWNNVLGMKLIEKSEKRSVLSYGDGQAQLELVKIDEKLNRAKAYGRIAFAVPLDEQPKINETIKKINGTILTPLITLETPGKANVRVIILADPDNHEICFVDEEGFSKLSQVDPEGNHLLEKNIKLDPFQTIEE